MLHTARRAAQRLRGVSPSLRRHKSLAPRAGAALEEGLLPPAPAPPAPTPLEHDDRGAARAAAAEAELLARHTLYERQLEREEDTLSEACDDYENMIENLMALGKSAELRPVQRLLASWYGPLVEAISEERAAALDGDKGDDLRIYGPLLMLLPPEQLAVLTMHHTLGQSMKHGFVGAKYSTLVTQLGEAVQAEARVLRLREARRARRALVKREAEERPDGAKPRGNALDRAGSSYLDPKVLAQLPSHVVNARARKVLDSEDPHGADADWPAATRAKVGGALVAAFLNIAKDPDTGEPLLEHVIAVSAQRKIGMIRAASDLITHARCPEVVSRAAMPRFLPMLVEPRPWRSFSQGGFLRLRAVAMRTHGCAIQTEAFRNARGLDRAVFAGLDAMGRVPWCINARVLDLVQEAWASGGVWPDLPSKRDFPLPEPFDEAALPPDQRGDEDEVRRAREAHSRRTTKVRRKNADLHSLRCDTELKLGIAEQYRHERAFYYPYNVDFRGRAYPVPPNLNHLGSDVCRAVLSFAEPKRLGAEGLYWLRVHLANLFGLSKKSLAEREAFALEHQDEVLSVARDPMHTTWWKTAEEPWQALACCLELSEALSRPDPENHESSLPVHMDGSCNGLQHYAALGRDREGGRQVNLLPGEEPNDVYEGVRRLVADKVSKCASGLADAPQRTSAFGVDLGGEGSGDATALEDESDDDLEPAAARARRKRAGTWTDADEALDARRRARIVDGLITRKVVKQTVMTSVYGVTFVGARQQILARLHDAVEEIQRAEGPAADAKRRELAALGCLTPEGEVDDDELYHCACYVAGLTLEVLEELFTSAREIMEWMAQCARLVALQDQPVSWITPLGLPVVQPYRRDGQHAVRTLAQTVLLVDHSDKLPVSVTRQKSAFPPNYVHSLDSTHMLMTAVEMDHRGLQFTAVHDSYWTHAADVPVMNSCLRRCFLDLYNEPLLEQLLESFQLRYPTTEFPPLPPRGELEISEVLDADYFFS